MADVTYNTASFPALVKTLKRLSSLQRLQTELPRSSSKPDSPKEQPPRILLAYKERDPAERELWGMLSDIGLTLKEIDRVPGTGGAEVEIYVGAFGSPDIAS